MGLRAGRRRSAAAAALAAALAAPLGAEPAAGQDLAAAPPVLAASVPGTPASGAPTFARALGRHLAARGAGTTSAAVLDLGSGEVVWADAGRVPVIPASTTKLLTAVAVLDALGPDHRFTTRLVRGRAPGELLLVGGGDPLLSATTGELPTGASRTPLTRLASRAAAALRALPSGQRPARVVVRPDDRLFAPPAAVPTWQPSYVRSGVAGRVGALSLDGGRRAPTGVARVGNPSGYAAAVLARQLSARGVPARPGSRLRADPDAVPLATVESAPLSEVVEHMLTASDNDVAEVLARHVAVAAGERPDAAGAAAAVRTAITDLDVDLAGARVLDGSGLSRGARLSPEQLVAVLAVAADPDRPELGSALSGLAVAGLTGTLANRYAAAGFLGGRGVVRAKTGGLRGVAALAGTTVTADGATYAFAFVANRVPGRLTPARRALDRAATALAACGCR